MSFEGWIHLVDPSPQEVQEIADSLPSVDALHPVARSRLTKASGYDALVWRTRLSNVGQNTSR